MSDRDGAFGRMFIGDVVRRGSALARLSHGQKVTQQKVPLDDLLGRDAELRVLRQIADRQVNVEDNEDSFTRALVESADVRDPGAAVIADDDHICLRERRTKAGGFFGMGDFVVACAFLLRGLVRHRLKSTHSECAPGIRSEQVRNVRDERDHETPMGSRCIAKKKRNTAGILPAVKAFVKGLMAYLR